MSEELGQSSLRLCEGCERSCDDTKDRVFSESEESTLCNSCYASELATRSISKRELRGAKTMKETDEFLKQIQIQDENAQWLRFAESAMSASIPKGFKESESWDHAMENIGVIACDIADAMLEEAKKRGRV